MTLFKKLIMMIFLVSTISCSHIVKPPELPIPESPNHIELTQEELNALSQCSQTCKQALKKINKNYQAVILYSKKLKAVLESQ